jgi:hypothetical protein
MQVYLGAPDPELLQVACECKCAKHIQLQYSAKVTIPFCHSRNYNKDNGAKQILIFFFNNSK